jgi:hypothetical protein
MTEVLAPDLELFRRKLKLIRKLHQRVTKAMRIGVGQPGGCECILEDFANGRRAAPVPAREAHGAEAASSVYPNLCRRKQRVVVAPELISFQEVHPVDHDCANIVANRKKEAWKGLGSLGCDLPCILINLTDGHLDVLQLEGCRSSISRPS